jgi:hypothetical protein
MANRIREIQVTQRRWDAAEAELWITVLPEQQTPATELRGRLVGPRCAGVSTVEVAYPLRPLLHAPKDKPGLLARIVIPEPLAWRPEQPFVYEGQVELWQDGEKCDQAPLRVLGRDAGGVGVVQG